MTVDYRTRVDAQQAPVEAGRFFAETLPPLLDAHQALLAPGAGELALPDFCIETEGEPFTLGFEQERFTVRPGRSGAARVRLDREVFSDLVNDQTTPIALMSNAVLDMPEGGLPDFLNWWLVLRGAVDGRPLHRRGDVAFAQGHRSFRETDPDEQMRAFLEDRGYLHIEGFFSAEEMAAVEADFDTAAPHYRKGDPMAWFATLKDGEERLVRMEGFDRYSPAAVELIESERFARLADVPGDGHVRVKKPGNRVGALTKPIGVVKGISDLPWHKDCSLGRHSYECCSVNVGISVTGAGPESGMLRVVPGSHRALVWPAPCVQPGLDLEPVDLPTRTGDLTVHLSCTLHMSQPPVRSPRKVMYTGFGQRSASPEAAEANRRKLSEVRSRTHTTVSQDPGYLGD